MKHKYISPGLKNLRKNNRIHLIEMLLSMTNALKINKIGKAMSFYFCNQPKTTLIEGYKLIKKIKKVVLLRCNCLESITIFVERRQNAGAYCVLRRSTGIGESEEAILNEVLKILTQNRLFWNEFHRKIGRISTTRGILMVRT